MKAAKLIVAFVLICSLVLSLGGCSKNGEQKSQGTSEDKGSISDKTIGEISGDEDVNVAGLKWDGGSMALFDSVDSQLNYMDNTYFQFYDLWPYQDDSLKNGTVAILVVTDFSHLTQEQWAEVSDDAYNNGDSPSIVVPYLQLTSENNKVENKELVLHNTYVSDNKYWLVYEFLADGLHESIDGSEVTVIYDVHRNNTNESEENIDSFMGTFQINGVETLDNAMDPVRESMLEWDAR